MYSTDELIQSLNNDLSTLKTNVQAKGVEVTEQDNFTSLASKVAEIPSGGGGEPDMITGVDFFDYDGTLLQHYTKEQVVNLETLPTPPTHEGLVFQEWNWSLANIKKEAVRQRVAVAPDYDTDDHGFHIHIKLTRDESIAVSVLCDTSGSWNNEDSITVYWGDNTDNTYYYGTDRVNSRFLATHTYSGAGTYVISVVNNNASGVARVCLPNFNQPYSIVFNSDWQDHINKGYLPTGYDRYLSNSTVEVNVGTRVQYGGNVNITTSTYPLRVCPTGFILSQPSGIPAVNCVVSVRDCMNTGCLSVPLLYIPKVLDEGGSNPHPYRISVSHNPSGTVFSFPDFPSTNPSGMMYLPTSNYRNVEYITIPEGSIDCFTGECLINYLYRPNFTSTTSGDYVNNTATVFRPFPGTWLTNFFKYITDNHLSNQSLYEHWSFATDLPSTLTIPDGIAYMNPNSVYDTFFGNVRKIVFPSTLKRLTNLGPSTNLQEVDFSKCTILTTLYNISSLTNVETIDLSACTSFSNNISIQQCKSLKHVYYPPNFSISSTSSVTDCPSLEEIDLSDCNYSYSGRFIVSKCFGLKRLKMSSVSRTHSCSTCIVDVCPNLEYLKLTPGLSAFSGSYLVCQKSATSLPFVVDCNEFTSVPTISNGNLNTNNVCQGIFHVPSCLYTDWSTDTNWAFYVTRGDISIISVPMLNVTYTTPASDVTLTVKDSEDKVINAYGDAGTYSARYVLEPGTYTVTAEATGYVSHDYTVTITNADVALSIELESE